MFNIGDVVFYPAYGVAVIDCIEEKEIDGSIKKCYNFHLLNNPMSISIPIKVAECSNMRYISNSSEMDLQLNEMVYRSDENLNDIIAANYKERREEFIRKIKHGTVGEYLEVILAITKLKNTHNLNSTERQILYRAKKIIIEEICVAKNISKEDAGKILEDIINK